MKGLVVKNDHSPAGLCPVRGAARLDTGVGEDGELSLQDGTPGDRLAGLPELGWFFRLPSGVRWLPRPPGVAPVRSRTSN